MAITINNINIKLLGLIQLIINTVVGTRTGIKDVLISMIPQFVTLIVSLITSVIIARGLGPEEMGKYALIISVSSLVITLSDLGVSQTAIRFASRAFSQGDDSGFYAILRWAFRLRIALLIIIILPIIILIPFIVSNIWYSDGLSSLINLNLITAIFAVLAAVPLIYFQSIKRFKINTIISASQTILIFIGIVIIASASLLSLNLIIIAMLISTGAGTFVSMLLIPKRSYIDDDNFKKPIITKLKTFFKEPEVGHGHIQEDSKMNQFLFYTVISTIIVAIMMRTDVWLMGYFLDKSQIGIYSVATYFTIPLVVVYNAMNTVLWPRASSLKSLKETTNFLKVTAILSGIVVIGGIIYSIVVPLSMPFIFGPKYDSGILTSQMLCLGYSIAILLCPISIVGYNFGMIRHYCGIHFAQLVITLTINLLLLSSMGIIASALAIVFYNIFGFAIAGAILLNKIKKLDI